MSHSPLSKPKTIRDPPPSLFLGPPSQNASHVSLPGVQPVPTTNPNTLNPSRAPLLRQRSQLATVTRSSPDDTANPLTTNNGPTLVSSTRPRQERERQLSENKKQADRTDALWAEMQRTLEEVELSAVNGTHVFGPDHSAALEELRTAQIGLAQAWARSEADEAVDEGSKESKLGATVGGKELAVGTGSDGRSLFDTVGSEGVSGSGNVGSSGLEGIEGGSFEEGKEHDILLARKRREANDRYFQRVNGGVLDVVKKLEEVAGAMRAVEEESRDIWGEGTESTRTSVHEG